MASCKEENLEEKGALRDRGWLELLVGAARRWQETVEHYFVPLEAMLAQRMQLSCGWRLLRTKLKDEGIEIGYGIGIGIGGRAELKGEFTRWIRLSAAG